MPSLHDASGAVTLTVGCFGTWMSSFFASRESTAMIVQAEDALDALRHARALLDHQHRGRTGANQPRIFGAIELIDPADGAPFVVEGGNALAYIAKQFAEFIGSRGVIVDAMQIRQRAVG